MLLCYCYNKWQTVMIIIIIMIVCMIEEKIWNMSWAPTPKRIGWRNMRCGSWGYQSTLPSPPPIDIYHYTLYPIYHYYYYLIHDWYSWLNQPDSGVMHGIWYCSFSASHSLSTNQHTIHTMHSGMSVLYYPLLTIYPLAARWIGQCSA